jgi:histidinol-phosphate/aromatic aminotransferase/cobyric acid decarboxylase-like protein
MEKGIQLHGSIPYGEVCSLGISPSEIHDFSATVNPFPLPEEIQKLINHEGIKAYPDHESFAAVSALSGLHDIAREMVVVCTGTAAYRQLRQGGNREK